MSPAAAVASFGRRAGWLVALASLTGATNAVSALHQFAARPGDDESLASALSTLFGALVTLAGMAFFCATMVAFLLWLHRAVACALALSPPPHVLDFTPGQAVLTYFIPIVGLFRPYSHMSRLLIAIDPLALPEPAPPPEPVGDYRSPGTRPAPEVRWPESAPVGLWWASWLALSVVGQISFRTDDETSAFSALFNAFIAVSSSLLVVVVRSVSLRLRELARRGSVPLPPKPFYG